MSVPTDKASIIKLLDDTLSRSPGEQTELVYIGQREATTRFAEDVIHQNMAAGDARVIVRLVKDGRVAISSTNDLTSAGLDRAMSDALQIAAWLAPDEGFPGFVQSPVAPVVEAFFPATADCSPAQRAGAVAAIVSAGRKSGIQSSGLYQTGTETIAVANSAGTRQFFAGTKAELSVSASDDPLLGQGWSTAAQRNVALIDAESIGRVAIDKAVRSRNPIAIPAGDYTVILEPAAVGQLLLFLGFLAFSGKSFAQGRGVFSGKLGETVTGANITIHEDPFLPEYPGVPFDYEGIPKQKVVLIENGIARGVVHDTRTAKMAGGTSTGHALPADNARGPYPKNLTLLPGTATMEEMIASMARGLLITHFWYLNYLNPMKAQVSGSTRDGTFLIANGAIMGPVKNLRATPAILEAFARAEQIGRERVFYPQYSAMMFVPAMKIAGFPFVEDTE
ncbi:MAG: TldD/PmbA family protein [Candidatus Zixiibacteriota bacterium]